MKLVFQNSYGKERNIGEPDTLDEAYQIINKFLDEHNFKSYYTRIQFVDDTPYRKYSIPRLEFDVGSHTEFFYLDEINDSTMNELKEKFSSNRE